MPKHLQSTASDVVIRAVGGYDERIGDVELLGSDAPLLALSPTSVISTRTKISPSEFIKERRKSAIH